MITARTESRPSRYRYFVDPFSFQFFPCSRIWDLRPCERVRHPPERRRAAGHLGPALEVSQNQPPSAAIGNRFVGDSCVTYSSFRVFLTHPCKLPVAAKACRTTTMGCSIGSSLFSNPCFLKCRRCPQRSAGRARLLPSRRISGKLPIDKKFLRKLQIIAKRVCHCPSTCVKLQSKAEIGPRHINQKKTNTK